MYNFKIDKIILKNGEEIIPNKINIIVGANSSGKSTFLKDIRKIIDDKNDNHKNKFIKEMEFDMPKNSKVFIRKYNLYNRIIYINNDACIKDYSGFHINSINNPNNTNLSEASTNYQIYLGHNWKENLDDYIKNSNKIDFLNTYGNLFCSYLGTEEKLLSIKKQRKYGQDENQINLLSDIMFNEKLLKKLSISIKSAFGKDIVLDYLTLGSQIGFRISGDFKNFRNIREANISEKIKILQNKSLLDDEGDGLKNYVATFLYLNLPQKNIILIDEPESHLHPPIAVKMGKLIASSVNDGKQIFIATHNPEIIKGLLNKSKEVLKDISIMYIKNENKKRVIKSVKLEELKDLTHDSTILFSDVINGLFCKRVYITESYNDSYFYDTLLAKGGGVEDYYFVNAPGKSQIYVIRDFFRDIGAKCYAIYDFDFFRTKEDIKNALHKKIEDNLYNEVIKNYQNIKCYFEVKAKDEKSTMNEYYHKKGINGLSEQLKKECSDCIDKLRNEGIIILKSGTLESTLNDVGIPATNNKNKWINDAIEFLEKSYKCDIKKTFIYNTIAK